MIRSRGSNLVALSAREREIAALNAAGWRPSEIASHLKLKTGTVEDYIFRLCQALGLRGRIELLLWAQANPGALTPDGIGSAGLQRKRPIAA